MLTEYVTEHFSRDILELTRSIEANQDVERDEVQQTSAMLRSWLLEPEMLLARVELRLEGSRQPAIVQITRAQSRQLEDIVELMHALREKPENRAPYVRDGLELLMEALVGEGSPPTV